MRREERMERGELVFAKGCKDTNRNSIEIYRQCKCGFWLFAAVFCCFCGVFNYCYIAISNYCKNTQISQKVDLGCFVQIKIIM